MDYAQAAFQRGLERPFEQKRQLDGVLGERDEGGPRAAQARIIAENR